MSTASLLRWIALVAGAELAVRGYLVNHVWTGHAGAALVAIAIAALTRPTRARRSGAIATAVLLSLVAVDAALAVFAAAPPPPPMSLRERTAPAPRNAALSPAAPSAPGSFAILVFAGRDPDGQLPLSATQLDAALRGLGCDPPIAVVEAGTREPLGDPAALEAALARFHPGLVLVLAANELLDDVIAESPALDFPALEAIGPRGSPLGRMLEGAVARWHREIAWRRALDTEVALDPRASRVVARYRALVLAARRAGSDVALLIPPLAIEPASADSDRIRAAETSAPRTRAWLLASRAHARGVRELAGSYAIPAIDTRPGLEGAGSEAFAELGRLDAAGRERLAHAVADALAGRLGRTAPGCLAIPRNLS